MKYLKSYLFGSFVFALLQILNLVYAFFVKGTPFDLSSWGFLILVTGIMGGVLLVPFTILYRIIPGKNVYHKAALYFVILMIAFYALSGFKDIISVDAVFSFTLTVLASQLFAMLSMRYNRALVG